MQQQSFTTEQVGEEQLEGIQMALRFHSNVTIAGHLNLMLLLIQHAKPRDSLRAIRVDAIINQSHPVSIVTASVNSHT